MMASLYRDVFLAGQACRGSGHVCHGRHTKWSHLSYADLSRLRPNDEDAELFILRISTWHHYWRPLMLTMELEILRDMTTQYEQITLLQKWLNY